MGLRGLASRLAVAMVACNGAVGSKVSMDDPEAKDMTGTYPWERDPVRG